MRAYFGPDAILHAFYVMGVKPSKPTPGGHGNLIAAAALEMRKQGGREVRTPPQVEGQTHDRTGQEAREGKSDSKAPWCGLSQHNTPPQRWGGRHVHTCCE